jgi:hypothetical protein
VNGGSVKNDEALADMDSFGGAPPEIVAAVSAEQVEMEVEPENWDTVMLFMRVQTQWRSSFAGLTGLDYTGVEAAMRMAGIERTPEIFDGLQVMEFTALKAMSEKG